jgi:hypothetical protein
MAASYNIQEDPKTFLRKAREIYNPSAWKKKQKKKVDGEIVVAEIKEN